VRGVVFVKENFELILPLIRLREDIVELPPTEYRLGETSTRLEELF
jgi:hypothetical protein